MPEYWFLISFRYNFRLSQYPVRPVFHDYRLWFWFDCLNCLSEMMLTTVSSILIICELQTRLEECKIYHPCFVVNGLNKYRRQSLKILPSFLSRRFLMSSVNFQTFFGRTLIYFKWLIFWWKFFILKGNVLTVNHLHRINLIP